MAEESTYVTRSTLMDAESGQHGRRSCFATGPWKGRGQVVEGSSRGLDVACGPETLEHARLRQRAEESHRAPAIGDLERDAALYVTKDCARGLS